MQHPKYETIMLLGGPAHGQVVSVVWGIDVCEVAELSWEAAMYPLRLEPIPTTSVVVRHQYRRWGEPHADGRFTRFRYVHPNSDGPRHSS